MSANLGITPDQERIDRLENDIKMLTVRLNALCIATGNEVHSFETKSGEILVTIRKIPPTQSCIVEFPNACVNG